MTTPSKTAEAVERLKAWASLIERPPKDDLSVDANTAETHAADIRLVLQALSTAQQSDARVREALEDIQTTASTWCGAPVPTLLWEAIERSKKVTAPKPEEGETALHPATRDLVDRFTAALADKLAKAEQKYGYSDGWRDPAWQDECRQQLHHHATKGDPRDVAAYAAFCWHHGWPTTLPASPAPSRVEPVAWRVKDFADGWFFYGKDQEPEATRAQVDGFLVQPLYTTPPDAQDRMAALEKENALLEAAVMGHQKCREVGLLNLTDDEVGRINDAHKSAVEAIRARAALKAEEKG